MKDQTEPSYRMIIARGTDEELFIVPVDDPETSRDELTKTSMNDTTETSVDDLKRS